MRTYKARVTARRGLKTFVALLRAVNVGGTGKLPMNDLKAMCEAAGFTEVRTFIASGNVIFKSGKPEAGIRAALEASLKDYAGKPIGVLVRTAAELAAVLKANPFPKAAPNLTVAIFLNKPPPSGGSIANHRASRRRSPARQAGDLRPLPRRNRQIEAQNPGRGGRHRPQHEHYRQVDRFGWISSIAYCVFAGSVGQP